MTIYMNVNITAYFEYIKTTRKLYIASAWLYLKNVHILLLIYCTLLIKSMYV